MIFILWFATVVLKEQDGISPWIIYLAKSERKWNIIGRNLPIEGTLYDTKSIIVYQIRPGGGVEQIP